MFYRDPRCVFVADTFGLAATVVGWLAGRGIDSEVMNELTYGGFEGLTALLPGKISLRGLEVWVTDVANADKARQLLAERDAAADAKIRRTGTVEAVCEKCAGASEFPAAEQGTIQDCPHCGAMLDVPDPDEDWDVGAPEDADEE